MQDTVETVPYLTHMDYARAIRELTEFVDYAVLNLADETNTSGIVQYYKKGSNLNKLLKNAHTARVNELGKAAASQFERYLEKNEPGQDFSATIRRFYQRQSLLSSLRPMMLLVQVDLTKMNEDSHKAFIDNLVTSCHANQIDGIVLRQNAFDEEARRALQSIKQADKTGSLIVVSEGR